LVDAFETNCDVSVTLTIKEIRKRLLSIKQKKDTVLLMNQIKMFEELIPKCKNNIIELQSLQSKLKYTINQLVSKRVKYQSELRATFELMNSEKMIFDKMSEINQITCEIKITKDKIDKCIEDIESQKNILHDCEKNIIITKEKYNTLITLLTHGEIFLSLTSMHADVDEMVIINDVVVVDSFKSENSKNIVATQVLNDNVILG